jgi:uncharacterized protein YbbK (DUF523 family)
MPLARVLVSACLLGEEVRYHGGSARIDSAILTRWQQQGRIVAVCPEVEGGLGTPRPPAEIVGLRVITNNGRDVTRAFAAGAARAVALARAHDIHVAVLKSYSPSCGITSIYDGTFSGRLTPGAGVTAAALAEIGVRLFDETQLVQANGLVESLDLV